MEATTVRVVLVIPYFGPWPRWFSYYLRSCAENPEVDWLFFSDSPAPAGAPPNTRFCRMTWDEFRARTEERLGIRLAAEDTYKICDLKPALGCLFREFLDGYDFWGFADIDIVFGKLARFLGREEFAYDVLSFHRDRISGHFCLLRNDDARIDLFRRVPNWRALLSEPAYRNFDEIHFHNAIRELPGVLYSEAFSTVLSRCRYWIDGTLDYPREWYWKDGRLTADKHPGLEFMYLHFMYWKGSRHGTQSSRTWATLPTICHVDPAEPGGWRIDIDGFHALDAGRASRAFSLPLQPTFSPHAQFLAMKSRSLLGRLRDRWRELTFLWHVRRHSW